MLVLIITLLLCVQASSFCYMNEVGGVKKQMLLHSKPTAKVLVNNFINKQAKQRGIPAYKIRSCIQDKQTKKKMTKPKKRLRG
jgi:hypothetical protein